MAKRKMRGVSRIDSPGKDMHGWYVRVYLYGKVYVNKYFSDKKYGGKRESLRASVQYRNEKREERTLKYPGSDHPRRRVLRDRRNKTGIIGVSKTHSYNRSGTVTESYQVTWRPRPKVTKSKCFSVKKYGEEGALFRAWKVRKEVELKIYGETQTPDFEKYRQNFHKDKKDLPDFSKLFLEK